MAMRRPRAGAPARAAPAIRDPPSTPPLSQHTHRPPPQHTHPGCKLAVTPPPVDRPIQLAQPRADAAASGNWCGGTGRQPEVSTPRECPVLYRALSLWTDYTQPRPPHHPPAHPPPMPATRARARSLPPLQAVLRSHRDRALQLRRYRRDLPADLDPISTRSRSDLDAGLRGAGACADPHQIAWLPDSDPHPVPDPYPSPPGP